MAIYSVDFSIVIGEGRGIYKVFLTLRGAEAFAKQNLAALADAVGAQAFVYRDHDTVCCYIKRPHQPIMVETETAPDVFTEVPA